MPREKFPLLPTIRRQRRTGDQPGVIGGEASPKSEQRANKVPGISPYRGGDFVFRSADSCRMCSP
jgi:hypothetical protein